MTKKKVDAPIQLTDEMMGLLEAVQRELGTSLEETAKRVALFAAGSNEVATLLAPFMRRGFVLNNRAYIGHEKVVPLKNEMKRVYPFATNRVHCKFTYDELEIIGDWVKCLESARSHVVTMLVIKGLEIGIIKRMSENLVEHC